MERASYKRCVFSSLMSEALGMPGFAGAMMSHQRLSLLITAP